MDLRALYYANPIVPFVIDSIIYAAIFTFLASIVFKPADTLSDEEKSKHKRLSLILAFAMGPIFAGTLYSANLNLEKLVSGGLLWAFLLLFGVIIIITLIIPLFKEKTPSGTDPTTTKKGIPKWVWIVIPLVIFLIAFVFRSFDPISGSIGKTGKGIFDLFIYFGLFAFLIVILIFTTKWKKEDKKDVTDADLSGVTESLKEIHDRLKKIEDSTTDEGKETKKEKKKKKTKLEKLIKSLRKLVGKINVLAHDTIVSLAKKIKWKLAKGLKVSTFHYPELEKKLTILITTINKIDKISEDSKKVVLGVKREAPKALFDSIDAVFGVLNYIKKETNEIRKIKLGEVLRDKAETKIPTEAETPDYGRLIKELQAPIAEDWNIKIFAVQKDLNNIKNKCTQILFEINKWMKWLEDHEYDLGDEFTEFPEEDEIESPERPVATPEEIAVVKQSLLRYVSDIYHNISDTNFVNLPDLKASKDISLVYCGIVGRFIKNILLLIESFEKICNMDAARKVLFEGTRNELTEKMDRIGVSALSIQSRLEMLKLERKPRRLNEAVIAFVNFANPILKEIEEKLKD